MTRDDHGERQVEWCSRSGGASSNAGEHSVRQAEYAVHREAVTIGLTRSRPMRPRTGGRLENIEDSTAQNGGRLEKIEDMLGHLQNVLDYIQANQDADGPNSDQGQHNGAASARGSMIDKLWLKERITAWKNPTFERFGYFAVRSQRGVNCRGSSCKGYSRIPPWHFLR